ncbi:MULTISPECIES: ribonuclease T2 family protein [Photobacterium]|uniref:Uncharacterized protein n=1 Tax=Photobacterium ganghwense TaxID=320778 RepID=A0A0J1HAA1_9GAMM|nr:MULTISPECIES: hypothetical protein [Photobacterium]KLV08603.1 hypothetical protein ABT57_12250 [Photobacterium ganghwense]MBV1839062.1 ribonuclease [Photobacterium ganghwense]PSU10719.1 ribonuclease [Photobacterium ganghwense]QSV12862.1 ribonuclease [Photobacterium ganghwense]
MPISQTRPIKHFAFLLIASLVPITSFASVKVNGSFTASERCPAFQSIKKQANPGDWYTDSGNTYQALQLNKPNGDWVQLAIPGAHPQERWVNLNCGKADFTQSQSPPFTASQNNKRQNNQCQIPNQHDSYVLAVSWQKGFCEHNKNANQKPECRAINHNKLTVNNLTLHGLWPNRNVCGTQYGYCEPAEPMRLSPSTIKAIAPWMPNFYYETDFGEYQWKKHGACQNRADDDYFLLATKLVQQVDQSVVGQFIKANIGKSVPVTHFREMMVASLGESATQGIQLSCLNGHYLQEIRLSLPNDFEQHSTLRAKLEAYSAQTGFKKRGQDKAFRGNCQANIRIED